MDRTVQTNHQKEEQQARRSLLLGIAIWFFHLNIINSLISLSCQWSWFPFKIGEAPGIKIVAAILTLLVALVMLYLIYLSWRSWRAFQTENPIKNPDLLQDTEKDSRPLVAFIAMLLNSLLLLFAIALFVPIFALKACV